MYIHVHVLPRGHRSSPHKIGQYRRGSGYTPAHQRKAKLQYYVRAVSQVSHVPGQMTLEMHQDARRCVKLWGAITFGDLKPPTNGPGTARCYLLESAASHTSTVESIPRRERTRSVSLA